MRRFIHDTLTVFFAVALFLVVVSTFAVAVAHSRPAPTVASTCYGSPAPVRAQADGSGVRAGRVDVHCAGAWRAFQGVMVYENGTGGQYGKWSYGGVRYVNGRGAETIAPWLRPYHGCGFWKQQVTIAGVTRYSDVTWFCS
jgi:hypothetical protein